MIDSESNKEGENSLKEDSKQINVVSLNCLSYLLVQFRLNLNEVTS